MYDNDLMPVTPVLLVGLDKGHEQFGYQILELANLAEANHMAVVATVTQKLERPNPATYFGKGKVEELKEALEYHDVKMIVTNDELSPSQIRNLEAQTGATVMDRTALILDIFASRAQTRVAKLQVQIAQLQYQLPRLRTSLNVRLDQQTGGGSGSFTSRGAGETKLETNRRTIEHQIAMLRQELREIESDDDVRRAHREKQDIKTVALVGYTNAGKSTIMNGFVSRFGEKQDKLVFQADMLFATLETSVRKLNLPDKNTFLLSDTVGFVSQLPHNLVAAFKATLAEAAKADLLIQVVDYADEHYRDMMDTTAKTLKEIGVGEIPMITVYNKADLRDNTSYPERDGDSLILSAQEDESLELLLDTIKQHIFSDHVKTTLLIPFDQGNIVSDLNENATVHSVDYMENGSLIEVTLSPVQAARYAMYRIDL